MLYQSFSELASTTKLTTHLISFLLLTTSPEPQTLTRAIPSCYISLLSFLIRPALEIPFTASLGSGP